MKATDMAARLAEVASVVEAAGVEPIDLAIYSRGELAVVHCASAEDVDRVLLLLDDAPAPYRQSPTLYQRWATFDEVVSVNVYGPARKGACTCDESAAVEATNARQSRFFARHPRVEAVD